MEPKFERGSKMLGERRIGVNGNGKHSAPRAGEIQLPPHSQEMERSLLGAMMRDNSIIPGVLAAAQAHHLYNDGHQRIFEAIAKLHSEGVGIEPATVAECLINANRITDAGGTPYLAELWDAAPSAANHEAYVKVILGKAVLRRLHWLGHDLQRRAFDPTTSHAELMADLESRVAEISHPIESARYRYRPMTSIEFAEADFKAEFLWKNGFVRGQPGVIGGPSKGMKTITGVELMVSLGSGCSVFGVLEVYRPLRVAVVSGESGQSTLQEIARRVCMSKGIRLADVNCKWSFDLPQLSNASDLRELQRGLRADRTEAAPLDPLYLMLLNGSTTSDASNFRPSDIALKSQQLS